MGKGGEIIIAVGLGDPFLGIWDVGKVLTELRRNDSTGRLVLFRYLPPNLRYLPKVGR
jgi:hypothetical protein